METYLLIDLIINFYRVNGVSGLRVIDASIMPAVPNANLNAPVMMIAEKGADEILKAWPLKSNPAS